MKFTDGVVVNHEIEERDMKKYYIMHLFKLALEKDPNDTHTLFQTGEFLGIIGDGPEAIVCFFLLSFHQV